MVAAEMSQKFAWKGAISRKNAGDLSDILRWKVGRERKHLTKRCRKRAMGTRNAEERRKAAGKHRKESFSVKLEMVAKYEPQANKSFLIQQFFKNVGEVWASSPHLRSKWNCTMKHNKNLGENRKESQLPIKSKGCNEHARFQGQLRFPRQAGDVPQPCRTGFEWCS